MKQAFLFIILLTVSALYASAQKDSLSIDTIGLVEPALRRSWDPTASPSATLPLLRSGTPYSMDLTNYNHHLYLDIDATGFFYNVENQLPFAKGYTAPGIRFSPTLIYGLNDRTLLRAGVNATLIAGCDSIHELRPILSLTYMPSQHLTLVAGTLYGSTDHRLDMPLYDPQRWIYHRLEEGIQIVTRYNHWRSDTWVDWWHYLVPNTADQEYFTFGSDHTFNIFSSKTNTFNQIIYPPDTADPTWAYLQSSGWTLNIPATFLAHHRGGELKTIDTTTLTHFNERIGLRCGHRVARQYVDHSYSRQWSLDVPVYFFHLSTHSANGYAFYPSTTFEWQHQRGFQELLILAQCGYWHGNGYQSYFGLPSFNSTALLAPTADARVRNMITFGLSAEHTYRQNTQVGLSAQLFYDLAFKQLDFTIGLYLRGKQKVKIL